jgi:hypothetical protein
VPAAPARVAGGGKDFFAGFESRPMHTAKEEILGRPDLVVGKSLP